MRVGGRKNLRRQEKAPPRGKPTALQRKPTSTSEAKPAQQELSNLQRDHLQRSGFIMSRSTDGTPLQGVRSL